MEEVLASSLDLKCPITGSPLICKSSQHPACSKSIALLTLLRYRGAQAAQQHTQQREHK